MIVSNQSNPKKPKWVYPTVYLLFIIISFLPLYTQIPYAPQDTQDVIINLLMVSIEPYLQFGPFFHIMTLLIIALIAIFEHKIGRILAAYMGLNFIVIALAQSIGVTAKYGFVIHTGSLITSLLLGFAWIAVAVRGDLEPSFQKVPLVRYLFLPLAILAFWSPLNAAVQPDFNPLRLITSPDYGLTFCFTTPVFLYLLILFYPKVNDFAYRITAFNGLLYGIFNLTHFLNPQLRWLGVLHLPLLILSIYALLLPRFHKRKVT